MGDLSKLTYDELLCLEQDIQKQKYQIEEAKREALRKNIKPLWAIVTIEFPVEGFIRVWQDWERDDIPTQEEYDEWVQQGAINFFYDNRGHIEDFIKFSTNKPVYEETRYFCDETSQTTNQKV